MHTVRTPIVPLPTGLLDKPTSRKLDAAILLGVPRHVGMRFKQPVKDIMGDGGVLEE